MTNCQPASTSPALEAQGIVKQFIRPGQSSPVTALSGVSLTVRTGSLTAIIGPDGAGKTTFMRLVCGLLKSDAGSLSVLGMDVASHPQAVQDHIGYMPQKFGLYEDLSVQENLDLYANLHAVPQAVRQERFQKLLDLTGLSPFTKRMAGKLSGGMKQKLGLACTLVSMPPLLLLDEPTVGVDPLSRRELWQILDTLSASGSLTVLVATAYLEEAEHCHDVYILHKGHILAQGAPDTLCHYAQGRCYVVRPPENVPPRLIQAALIDETEAVADAVPEGGAVRFSLTPQASLKDLALPGLTVTAVPARLEDSFMSLLRQQEPSLPSHYSRPDMTTAKRVETGRKIIEVRDIVRRFGDFIAVNHTSFSVYEGEIFGLLGPNGAGKSTTFRMLCGLLPVSSGQISVAGVNLRTARGQGPYRLRSAKILPLHDAVRRREPPLLRQCLRPARPPAGPAHRSGHRRIRFVRLPPYAGRQPSWRLQTTPVHGSGPAPRTTYPLSRRTDKRHRPAGPPSLLAADHGPVGQGDDDHRHDTFHGRSRILRPHHDTGPGAAHRHRHAVGHPETRR